MLLNRVWILAVAFLIAPHYGIAKAPVPLSSPPPVGQIIKPGLYKKMLEDREILASAHLNEGHYSYYTSMLVRADLSRTKRILTDYRVYSKIIPYVDRTDFDAEKQQLLVEGGIWKFKIRSLVRFEEKAERWIRYRIVSGHFAGLEGNITFEPLGEKGTLVYFDGDQDGTNWPPKFVIERGAEIVFGFTAKRMRNYVEQNEDSPSQPLPNHEGKGSHDSHQQELPKPRSHL